VALPAIHDGRVVFGAPKGAHALVANQRTVRFPVFNAAQVLGQRRGVRDRAQEIAAAYQWQVARKLLKTILYNSLSLPILKEEEETNVNEPLKLLT